MDVSLVDWGEPFADVPPPDLDEVTINLDETLLAGLGAIGNGNGTVWALARVPALSGKVELIDGERVDLSNLQRYVATIRG